MRCLLWWLQRKNFILVGFIYIGSMLESSAICLQAWLLYWRSSPLTRCSMLTYLTLSLNLIYWFFITSIFYCVVSTSIVLIEAFFWKQVHNLDCFQQLIFVCLDELLLSLNSKCLRVAQSLQLRRCSDLLLLSFRKRHATGCFSIIALSTAIDW